MKGIDENNEEEVTELSEEIENKEIPQMDIQEELEATIKQLDDQKDLYLRLVAEFDNFRKKTQKEKEEFKKYANEKLILELLDVCESIERGVDNSRSDGEKDKLIEGMELIHKQFTDVLKKNGLVPIKSKGEKFDPYRHEALMQTETDECEEGTVLEEYTRGYMLNNKVIRYSKVRVSKNKETEK